MQKINLVWLKRDLRITDHEPLQKALATGIPTLLVYIMEPSLLADPHYSTRHWRFIWQSIQDINKQLSKHNAQVQVLYGEALECFIELTKHYQVTAVYSHQEIGIQKTFHRDKQVSTWIERHSICWYQTPYAAVIRGLKNRKSWDKHWRAVMRANIPELHLSENAFTSNINSKLKFEPPKEWLAHDPNMQMGGSKAAWSCKESFFENRGQNYYCQLSSPLSAEHSCSRLSPYLAWGNISLREIYQQVLLRWQTKGWRRTLVALSSRLHWHCHFIQKFESETEMEQRCLNCGYDSLLAQSHCRNLDLVQAWAEGRTGFPMVDACMRSLQHTGYLNFRMRAMLVSVLTHHLNCDWRDGVHHLARLFLDFEPGIHYPQFQMQAGITGINTIRIYNPTKQANEQDPEGIFIKRWIPELAEVPVPLLFEPWKLTPMEQQMYQIPSDSIYLNPVIDLQEGARQARERLWGWRKKPQVQQEAKRILAKHVRIT